MEWDTDGTFSLHVMQGIAQCHQFLHDGGELDELSGRLHIAGTELLGRLLQLPTVKQAASENVESEFDLWSVDRLEGVL